MTNKIVLATPHKRYNGLEAALRDKHGFQVERIHEKDDLTAARLEKLKPAYVFFPHWSWIIPKNVHTQFKCIIFHMTDVPFGRGGSPLQNLIVRGIAETKLSAIKCVTELDAGPVYLKMPLSLDGTAENIFARAGKLMENMIVKIATQNPTPVEQKGDPVIFQRRTPEDGDIAAAKSLKSVYDMIRMLDAEGYPPAFVTVGGLRFEFNRAKLASGSVTAEVRITLDEKSKTS